LQASQEEFSIKWQNIIQKVKKLFENMSPKLKSIFKMWPKRGFFFLIQKLQKNPQPKTENMQPIIFIKKIIIIIIIICAKLQKRLPSFGLEISRDASRKAVKVHPLQINTRTKFIK